VEPSTMNMIVVSLLTWITTHTNYPMPDQTPVVVLAPHAYIEQVACGEPCEALGAYPDGNVIYIDEALQVDRNVCAKSVLLHELVHYLQDKHERFEAIPPVVRGMYREREAYAVQKKFLAESGRIVAFDRNFRLGAFIGPTC